MQITTTTPCTASRGGGTQQSSIYREAPPQGPAPYTLKYRKIPKISPGAYIFQAPFLRGLFLEGPTIVHSEGLVHRGKFVL